MTDGTATRAPEGAASSFLSIPDLTPAERRDLDVRALGIAGSDEFAAPPFRVLRDRPAGRDRRRVASIHGYIGGNGMGKSLAMVHDTLPSLDSGRTVLSTVPLKDPAGGWPHPAYVPFTDWSQLLDAEHCDVLMDEISGIANSRQWARLPGPVATLLDQLRKRDVVLRWTAPAWRRADVTIRDVSQAVTVCRGYMAEPVGKDQRDGRSRLWQPRRLFRWRTFNGADFETWSQSKEGRLRPEVRAWFWGPASRAFFAYDTLGAVNTVRGERDEHGMCAVCGGKPKPPPACSCELPAAGRVGRDFLAARESQSRGVVFAESTSHGAPDDAVQHPERQQAAENGEGDADQQRDESARESATKVHPVMVPLVGPPGLPRERVTRT